MDAIEKRQSQRINVSIPVSFEQLGPGKNTGRTVTRNISVTGLRMNMPSFFPAGSSFLLKLTFPEVNRVIESIARVVWSQRRPFSDQYQAGLHFAEINPVFKKWLEEYIIVNTALSR